MNNIRKQFPILKRKINGKPLIYFDNGATTQKPLSVINAISDFYKKSNANVHRSMNPLAEEATQAYEGARKKVSKFLNAQHASEIIFVRNTTEAMNLVAKSWGQKHLKKGDIVLTTVFEHHSNIVPWLQLKQSKGIKIEYIGITSKGTLDMKDAKKKLQNKKVKMLAFAHASNTLGVVHPAEKLVAMAKKSGVMTCIDAAQTAGHMKLDVRKLGCDFLALSGHKMYGPTGIGVLYGKSELLEDMPAWMGGGEMIHEVFPDTFTVAEIPHKFEAGTPNIAGAVGLGAAVDFISSIGWKKIKSEELKMTKYLYTQLSKLKFVKVYGKGDVKHHLPTVAFTMRGVHAHDVAELLGQEGIAVRAGHHCTQPLHDYLKVAATTRASLTLYNTKEEVNSFVKVLEKIYKKFQ